jgi:hypothetical protein
VRLKSQDFSEHYGCLGYGGMPTLLRNGTMVAAAMFIILVAAIVELFT